MSAIVCIVAVWFGVMCIAVGLLAVARVVLQRHRQTEATRTGLSNDSAAPILRWTLRKRPAALNRKLAAEALETMGETGMTLEMTDVLRERNPYASRTAAKILGEMRTKGHYTARA